MPWVDWAASPSYETYPVSGWTEFASTSGPVPVIATPPVGDWAITATITYVGGVLLLAGPEEHPVNVPTSVQWEAGHEDQQFFNTNLDYGTISQRVFPEKNSPTSPNFNQVKGTIELARFVAPGFTFLARLKPLDPDHIHLPANGNDHFDPDDVFGPTIDIKRPDNRQTAGGFGGLGMSPTSAVVDVPGLSNGRSATFTIDDAQPGNNFIVAAGRDAGVINRIGVSDDDGVTPVLMKVVMGQESFTPIAAHAYSNILTVWRTLWIETDSMRAPDPNTEGPFDQPPILVNGQMVEDPEYDKNFGDVPDPPTDLLAAEYARANIEVKIVELANDPTDGNGDPATGDPGWFAHYLDYNPNNGQMPAALGRAATMADWAADNANNFWVGQLIGAYELHMALDFDPNDETTFPVFGITVTGTNVAFIFFETSRDYVAYLTPRPGPPRITDEATFHRRSVLHETGHFFGLPDYYQPGDPRGIMNYFDASFGPDSIAGFNWNDLGQIQGHPKPQL